VQARDAMKVAFATRDREHVNEELRRAAQLLVYEVTAEGHRLEREWAFPAEAGHRSDDRIRAIAGSAIVYVSAVGPSVAARLASRGIRVATAPDGARISDLLAELQRMIASRERGPATVE
jgi:nitrogen fixation protein NifX